MGLLSLRNRISELLRSSQSEMRDLGTTLKTEHEMAINVHVPIVELLQMKNPQIIITGSTALFLHGIRLKRWRNDKSDIDLISPYFTELSSIPSSEIPKEIDISMFKLDDFKLKGSIEGDDKKAFHYKKMVNVFTVLEMRIDPMEPYDIVEYQGVKYKVAKLENILFAKMLYARDGNEKHIEDIYEICGKPVIKKVEPVYTSYAGS